MTRSAALLVDARLPGLPRRRSVKPKPIRRQSPSRAVRGHFISGAIPACSYPLYASCRSAKPALAGRLRTQKSFLTTGYPRSTRPHGFFRNVIATCQAGILTDPHEPTRSLRRTPCLHSLSSSLWCRLLTTPRCTRGRPKPSPLWVLSPSAIALNCARSRCGLHCLQVVKYALG